MTPWSMLLGFKWNFFNFLWKLSKIFLVENLTDRFFYSFNHSFWEHIFLARMWCLKNGWQLSAPPRTYFYHPQLFKKIYRESWDLTAFTKKSVVQICATWVYLWGQSHQKLVNLRVFTTRSVFGHNKKSYICKDCVV